MGLSPAEISAPRSLRTGWRCRVAGEPTRRSERLSGGVARLVVPDEGVQWPAGSGDLHLSVLAFERGGVSLDRLASRWFALAGERRTRFGTIDVGGARPPPLVSLPRLYTVSSSWPTSIPLCAAGSQTWTDRATAESRSSGSNGTSSRRPPRPLLALPGPMGVLAGDYTVTEVTPTKPQGMRTRGDGVTRLSSPVSEGWTRRY